MATVLAKVERPCAVKQLITAGSNFNGTEPTTTVTFADDVFKYATHTAGGLFKHNSAKYAFDPHEAWLVIGIEIDLADQASWSVNLIDVDDAETLVASGTNEASYVRGGDDPIVVLCEEGIKIVSAGASAAMTARVKYAPYPTLQL